MRNRYLSVVALALLVVLGTAAQEPQPVSFIAEFHVKPGKESQFMDLVKKYDEPLFAKLMAEGAVLAWGVNIPVLHMPGGGTHSLWWSSPDMGAVDKVFAAVEEMEKKIAADEAAAAEDARRRRQAPPKTIMESLGEAVDMSSHRDWLIRSQKFNFTQAPPAPGARPYNWITVVKVKPGKEGEFRRLLDKYIFPAYDRLVANGSIIGYEFGTEEVRTSGNFTHYFWVVLPDLAAREKARAAFAALNRERSEEARDEISDLFLKTYDPDSLRNYLERTIVLHVAPPR